MRDLFCNNEEYSVKVVPNNLGYFEKQKLIKEHVELIANDDVLIYLEGCYIGWVEVSSNAKYWAPYERLNYFIDTYRIVEKDFLVIEQQDLCVYFYVVIDGFLFFYSRDYDKSIDIFQKNNVLNYKTISVGCLDLDCDVLHGYKIKTYEINESTDGYGGVHDDFFSWFENKKISVKKENIKTCVVVAVCFVMLVLNVVFYFNNQELYEELLRTLNNNS